MAELYSLTTTFSFSPFLPPSYIGIGGGAAPAPAKYINIPCHHCGLDPYRASKLRDQTSVDIEEFAKENLKN